jgi:hypothetical protein
MCGGCAVLDTLQMMVQRRDEKLKTKETKIENHKAKRKKRAYLRILIPIALFVVIATAELLFYFRISKPEGEEFNPSQHPAATIMIIDEAIQDYSRDHGGAVPSRLEELLGNYLPPEKIEPGEFDNLSYTPSSPHSYKLTTKNMDKSPIPDFVFTEEAFGFGETQ